MMKRLGELHRKRWGDNANFFAVLKGEESPKWSFEKDLKAIDLMDKIEEA